MKENSFDQASVQVLKNLEAILWQWNYISHKPGKTILMQDFVHVCHEQC